MTAPEAFASVGISAILHKVTEMEKHMAVMACDLSALRKTTTEDIADLDTRMRATEADRFPWAKIAGIVGLLGLVVAVIALFVK